MKVKKIKTKKNKIRCASIEMYTRGPEAENERLRK